MRLLVLPIVCLTLVAFGSVTSGITEEERERTVTELIRTRKYLRNTLEGLSESQLNYKLNSNVWSISECLEHLAISETMFGKMLEEALKTTADPSKRDSVALSDEDLMALVINREEKIKTSTAFEPSGAYGSHAATLKAFLQQREAHIEYVKKTTDDLRNHYGQLPFGTIDGLQILLFMSAHTERHILQMEEVMANEHFPR